MNALTKSRERNQAFRTSAYDGALRTRAAGVVNISPGPGLSIFGDNRQQGADRQRYGQNRGWLYAAVNAIASEGAAQPVVVAKLLGAAPKTETAGKLRTKSLARERLQARVKTHVMRKMSHRARTKAAAEETEVLTTHPIIDLLEQPNPIQSRWQFTYSFIASLCLTGMAYIIGGENDDGKFELYSLPTTWVTPKHEKGPFSEFEIKNPNDPAAQPEILTRENVAFAMLPNPANPLAAISPASTQSTSIRIMEKIEASQDQFFDNGIFPSVIVTMGQDPHPDMPGGGTRPRLNAAQRRQVHAAIGKVMSGVANYGSPAIIDGLIESITKFSNTADEMGWEKSEEIVKKRIYAAFCVHPYITGEAVSVGGYAQVFNIESRFFSRVNIYLDMLGGCVTNFVAPIVGKKNKEKLLVWWEEKVANDPSLRWANLNAARTRDDISQNELRAELGLPPDEDKTEQKINAANGALVIQLLPLIAGGQCTSEQAQTFFEGLGIEPDIAEGLAGDGAAMMAAQQELQAASAALQTEQTLAVHEATKPAEEVEKAVSRLLGGFDGGLKASLGFTGEKGKDTSEFSCVMFMLPDPAAQEVASIGEQIKDSDLAADGREEEPHITVKFGLHTNNTDAVQKIVEGFGPVTITFGDITVFPAKETDSQRGGDQYDVVKIDVHSDDLMKLNKLVSTKLECTDTHPTYKPHCTLAYVKPDKGQMYADSLNNIMKGRHVEFDSVVFSDKNHEHHVIHLDAF